MKKILFAIAIVMTMSVVSNAQSDGFFRGYNNDIYNNRGTLDDAGLGLPGAGMVTGGTYGNDQNTPLGSGLLVLTALGAGYAVYRKKRS